MLLVCIPITLVNSIKVTKVQNFIWNLVMKSIQLLINSK